MIDWVVEFVGGPIDGRVQTMSRLPMDYRVPMLTSSIQSWLDEPDPIAAVMSKVVMGTYKPRTNNHGVHSINDEGHVLFDWEGMR